MTDIDILNTSWKTEVTPEQSAEIQRLLFGLGFCWLWSKSKEITFTSSKYLFFCLSCGAITKDDKDKDFYLQHNYDEINADDIIAALRKLEEGDKPVIKKTNEDGWINVYKKMPALAEIVEVKTSVLMRITKAVLVWYSPNCIYFHEVDDSLNKKNILLEYVLSWRPLKQKRPDFGKLRCEDFIVFEYDKRHQDPKLKYSKNSGFVKTGFLESNGYLTVAQELQYCYFHDEIQYDKDKITKITRINLDTREFEEI